MASEYVIELGSSDDDAEPVPKKAKTVLNAMVHIPRKLPGVTIKPAKPKNKLSVLDKLAAKPITVTKVPNLIQNPSIKKKTNIRPDQKPHTILAKAFNPLVVQKMATSQLIINKVPSVNRTLKTPVTLHSPKSINNLPPSITIKRTRVPINNVVLNKNAVLGGQINPAKKKRKVAPKTVTEVPTVELDDDECDQSSNHSPQWYLRPEEQTKINNIEEQNNKEPETIKHIEIIIEDSPVKPIPNKRTCEIGTELAITIDDSPIKPGPEKEVSLSGSDNETSVIETEPHSRKKLEYPNDGTVKCIEIELEPTVVDIQNEANTEENRQEVEVSFQDDVVEIQEKSVSKIDQTQIEAPEKNTPHSRVESPDPKVSEPMEVVEVNDKDKDSEFHPVYQSFIDLCFKLENSEDMKKIVEKKIKAYYRQVPKEYTESEVFIDMVSSKILSMKAGPEKMYLYIKDIVDELNLQRKMAKSQAASNVAANKCNKDESNKYLYGEESEFDSKRQRQIRKLEKTLKKLHRAIQLLEEQEVDFDDDDDSVYLLTESEDESSNKDANRPKEKDISALIRRYKERMVRVHAKFCQLTNTKMPSEPRVQIDARPGHPAGPAKRLEKWINRKVPIGTPLPFPDFHDVLRCVRDANEDDKLGWNEADIMEEARDLFIRCGKKLQRRRQENEWRLASSRITLDEDPAEKNEDLKNKLIANKDMATKKEADLFNKYADRQNQLKLEAEEIGDKEAEESPVESEEEENNDEGTSLQSKEKRKERLRRLLQEKSKKTVEEKRAVENTEDKKETTPEKNSEDSVQKESNENDAKISENKESKIANEAIISEVNSEDGESSGHEKVQTLSDDSNKVNSDVDELHLLQKLHSENEVQSSTLESSDTDSSPIAISDTLGSSGDNRKQASDVISIENSSYSESEAAKTYMTDKEEAITEFKKSGIIENKDVEVIIQESNDVQKSFQKTNNNEYIESIEDILLASTDEENEPKEQGLEGETCVNLQNDAISIEETVVEGEQAHIENPKVTNDVDMADKIDNNGDSLDSAPIVDNMETEPEVICNTDSLDSNTAQSEIGDVIKPNNSESIEKVEGNAVNVNADTISIESLGSSSEATELVPDASPGVTV